MNEDEKDKLRNLSDDSIYKTKWHSDSFDVFVASLNIYVNLLRDISNVGTKKINNEIEYVKKIINRLLVARNSDGVSLKDLAIEGEVYKLLNSTVNKHRALLNQIYSRKKQTILVPEQLQPEEELLEKMRKVLDNDVFHNVPRRKLIIENFAVAYFSKQNSEDSPSESRLLETPDQKKYLVESGTKHYIPDTETREQLGYSLSEFKKISEKESKNIPTGKPLLSKKRSKHATSLQTINNYYAPIGNIGNVKGKVQQKIHTDNRKGKLNSKEGIWTKIGVIVAVIGVIATIVAIFISQE
jgi:hypothetical protein